MSNKATAILISKLLFDLMITKGKVGPKTFNIVLFFVNRTIMSKSACWVWIKTVELWR